MILHHVHGVIEGLLAAVRDDIGFNFNSFNVSSLVGLVPKFRDTFVDLFDFGLVIT